MAALDFPSSPTVGQVYTANGKSWQWDGVSWISYNTLIAAGSNTQIQFNNSGAFGASSNLTWNGSTLATTGLSYAGTLTGGTGVIAIGTNQIYKDASGSVGIGTSSLGAKLHVNGGSMWVINSAADPRILVGEGVGANEYGYLLWDRTANTLNLRTNANPITFGSDTADWMRIDSSGNVGIGTSSPGVRLHVSSTDTLPSALRLQNTTATTGNTWQITSTNAGVLQLATRPGVADYLTVSATGVITLGSAVSLDPTTANSLIVNSSGNVGIGRASSTGAKMDVLCATNLGFTISDGTYNAILTPSAVGGIALYATSNHPLLFGTNNAERARITPAGDLFVGDTSTPTAARIVSKNVIGQYCYLSNAANQSGGFYHIQFYASGTGAVGNITSTTTSTTYGTSSDYRLKENVQPIQNALSRVSLLKPSTYNWTVDGSDGEGFIAHELQEVVPQAVSGEKDGEQMQGVDYGKLTPLLAAAIQELHAEIESLKAKVN